MEIQSIQVVDNLRKIEVKLDENIITTTPRQAITTTNLNHSETVDYKTSFLEILIESINNLKDSEGYIKELNKAKKYIQKNLNKIPIITIKGIASKTIKVSDFKLICGFQRDVGISNIRLFFKENLYKKIDELIEWVEQKIGNNYSFILDNNMNLRDFKRLYLLALEKNHKIVYFINRKPTKNNKEKFVFIQGRTNDRIIRWISLLNKKAEKGSLNPLFYYWLGYDIIAFTTRRGRYQVPEYDLEVIKNFNYVPATECSNEQCVIIPSNTLAQSIEKYSLRKSDSIPCSAFSIVELNTNFENFAKNMDRKQIMPLIVGDVKRFNELFVQSS